jgi:hypothetical protein
MSDKSTTTVNEVDDITSLLAQPGAENIMLPASEQKKDDEKTGMFKRNPKVDLSFLDKSEDPENGKGDLEDPSKKKTPDSSTSTDPDPDSKDSIEKGKEILNDILDNTGDDDGDKGGDPTNKGAGRPKVDKNALYEFTKKQIEAKKLIPFDDEKPLEEYTIADYEELYEANEQAKEEKLQEKIATGFFDSLPEKLKTAAAYVANGGTDLKGIFRALAEAEETAELDTSTEHGQEAIARQYLQSTNFGTAEEIQEQIDEWRDQEILEKKAGQFKPKLDALQEKYLQYKVQEQENLRRQQQEQAQEYMKNVYEILEPGELGGVKLDKKVQSMLYAGLTQPSYPSLSGKQTNLLGHLLEKYQWVEPKHDLVAEALWLLADPEGYKSKIREFGKKEATAQTVRTLKTEEKNKITSTGTSEEPEDNGKSMKLPRPSKSFFKR